MVRGCATALLACCLASCAARDVHGNKYRCPAGNQDPRCAKKTDMSGDCIPIYHNRRYVKCVDRSEIRGVLREMGVVK